MDKPTQAHLAQALMDRVQVDEKTGCWLWTGAKNSSGYGQVRLVGRSVMAHRAMYELKRGLVPSWLVIDHTCDNPSCVNPSHLEPVTHGENIARQHRSKMANTGKIETVKDLVKAFGSREQAAQWFGVTGPAVSQWRAVPARHHRKLMEHARRKRWKLADAVFEEVSG